MAGLEVEEGITEADLNEDELLLVQQMRADRAKLAAVEEVKALLEGVAAQFPAFEEPIRAFIEKKIQKTPSTSSIQRVFSGWLVTHTDGDGETVYCPNGEQARLYVASLNDKGCPAGTTASFPKQALTRGFSVEMCTDPKIIEKYPTVDGFKRVYEGKKRTCFATKVQ